MVASIVVPTTSRARPVDGLTLVTKHCAVWYASGGHQPRDYRRLVRWGWAHTAMTTPSRMPVLKLFSKADPRHPYEGDGRSILPCAPALDGPDGPDGLIFAYAAGDGQLFGYCVSTHLSPQDHARAW